MPVPYMVYAETTGYPVMGGTGTTSPTDYITDASEPNEEITDIKPAMMAGALPEPSMACYCCRRLQFLPLDVACG